MIARHLLIAFMLLFGLFASTDAQEKSIIVASTTSTQDSGLFGHLLPIFKAKTGINVKVVAQGTGQALQAARRGDADVVFVHARPLEEQFVADGFGVKRFPVMYDDFILVGPKSDPARAKGRDIVAGLTKIKAKGASFISRGDRSGTHAAELKFWKIAQVDITNKKIKGSWYKAVGQDMGAALNTAAASNSYVLADRGTWLPEAVQPVRRHPGEPGTAPPRQAGTGPSLHRLAGFP